MPLTLKFSKQAAALVCSLAKQRILFPVIRPQPLLYSRDSPGPPKLCWAKAPTGISSDAHEDISDGSSLSPAAEPVLPRSPAGSRGGTQSHRLGQDACARTGVGVKGGSRGRTVPLQGRGSSSSEPRVTSSVPARGGRDGLVGAACDRALPGR